VVSLDPGEDRDAARYQRDLVLRKMFDTGYIPSQDYNEALRRRCRSGGRGPDGGVGVHRAAATRDFAELAHEELISMYGANTVLQGGLSVYTTIDLETQVTAREIVYGPTGISPTRKTPTWPSSLWSRIPGA
jgi:penicillin-binding protein 1A